MTTDLSDDDDGKPINPKVALGDNQPPTLLEILRARYKPEIAEIDKLRATANGLKKVVESDDDLPPFVQAVKDARAILKGNNDKRKKETEEFRKATEDTNAFFAEILGPIERIKTAMEDRLTAWNDKKEADERKRLADIAEVAAAEAAKLVDEADALGDTVAGDVVRMGADKAQERHEGAANAALGSSADLTRTRTSAGTVSSTGSWTFQIEDVSKIPLAKLRPFLEIAHIETALRKYAKANQDKAPLAGVRFYKSNKAHIR